MPLTSLHLRILHLCIFLLHTRPAAFLSDREVLTGGLALWGSTPNSLPWEAPSAPLCFSWEPDLVTQEPPPGWQGAVR